ncbi:tyrosine-type recombinase/integrase [Paludisphaera soli]|uniref:tyrosine-type recombinase/integrase n=1 Tax=Paludisphaera soli TaxID=2712865 RepID=UPI0013EACA3A|nr:tyrosine-type recombinase/integrase [Paludisphaera soli]
MGSVYRKTIPRPIPTGATIVRNRDGTQTAKWTPRGARRPLTAPVRIMDDGRQVINQETGCYYAKYRDADGLVRTASTGCRDKAAAEQFLSELERRAERVRSGVMSRAELAVADHVAAPIRGHIVDYAATLGEGRHAALTRRYLERLAEAFGWRTLADLRRDDLELWLADQSRPREDGKPARSARSRVGFQTAAVAFCNWLVEVRRLASNPFDRMSKPRIDSDRRRVRRALSRAELLRLIQAAQEAPERPPWIRGATDAHRGDRPAVRLSGRSRAALYALLAGTGLRVGEARKVRVADLDLDGDRPGMVLSGAATKNGEAAFIPLRGDLAAMLRLEVAGRRPTDPVFDIPADLLRRFYGDLKRAGIPKTDGRGRILDIHALRTTFGTHLAAAGVPLATAQKLMRHADPKLTANVYTDAALLDLHGAVEALPGAASVVATVAPTGGTTGHFVSSPDTDRDRDGHDASACRATKNPAFRRVS